MRLALLLAPAVLLAGCAQEHYVQSISVVPNIANTAAAGETVQFQAIANFDNGITKNITNQVTWASSTANAATIDSLGMATSRCLSGTDTSTVTASLNGSQPGLHLHTAVVGQALLTVCHQ
ncbi:MAG: hypothetical protein JOZ43_06480 [Acidobacteriales bacterium]|nr:hypothetical protein [Terriglobales bacterium]